MPHLSTTETRNYRPLDRRNEYPWEVLKERLVRELGPDFATFLAEPITRANEGIVDWYTESTKPSVAAADMAPGDREKLFDRLHAMRTQIYALADKIEAPGRRDGDKRFAEAIRRATIVPSNARDVWSLGGQPTLVLWGMQAVDDERPIDVLLAAVRDPRARPTVTGAKVEPVAPPASPAPPAEPSAPPVSPPPETRRKFRFGLLLWLLLAAVLLAAIGYFLVSRCDLPIALLRQFGIDTCDSTAAPSAPTDRLGATEICKELKARGTPCRPEAKVQISIGWKGPDDIDLYIDCPGGMLSLHGETSCGAENFRDTIYPEPNRLSVESAEWTSPPQGRYRIRVQLFTKTGQGEVPYIALIKCGESTKTVAGRVVGEKQMTILTELEYPGCK